MSSQTLAQLRVRLDELISDPNDNKFTQAAKKRALNTCLQDEISSTLLSYIREDNIQFRDGEYTYDFPADMLEPVAVMIQELTGEVVVNSSWRSLVGNMDFSASYPAGSDVFWQVTSLTGGKLMLRDIVPANKFIATPLYDADVESATVTTDDEIPDSAVLNEIWVDSYDDQDLVYKASEAYSAAAEYSTLTIDSDSLADGTTTDLVFTADDAGITRIQVVFETTTDPSSVATTGTGTRADPYVVTFSLLVSDNSNTKIIALAATTSILTAAGADAAVGTFTPIAATALENPAEARWTPQYIHVRYAAPYPELSGETDELHESLPTTIRNGDCLPLMAAVKLLSMSRGDERIHAMRGSYKKEYQDILKRVRYHNRDTGAPHDLQPS